MPAQLDIRLQRNEDWARTLYLTADGAPIDLTDMAAEMQVREKLTQALVTTAAVRIVDPPSAGIVDVELVGGEGSPLAAYGASIQQAELFYDFRLTDNMGTRVPLFGGRIIITRGETRA